MITRIFTAVCLTLSLAAASQAAVLLTDPGQEENYISVQFAAAVEDLNYIKVDGQPLSGHLTGVSPTFWVPKGDPIFESEIDGDYPFTVHDLSGFRNLKEGVISVGEGKNPRYFDYFGTGFTPVISTQASQSALPTPEPATLVLGLAGLLAAVAGGRSLMSRSRRNR